MRTPAVPLRVVLAWAGVGSAVALLTVRLVHDVGTKPYSEDEAVAGLIAARPLGEVLRTVVWNRGGSPLHFVLAHVVLEIWPSAGALRWLSVVCAAGAVVCAYALATELAGMTAGVAAAWLVAASDLLRVYGTFGRMYSLLALVGGLNMLLFARTLSRPTRRRVWLAAASAWLLAATHPFGLVPVIAEAGVALYLWRGRGWSRALPGLVTALATVPLFAGELRLAGRFGVSTSGGQTLGSGGAARGQFDAALRGFAGGGGATLWLFVALGLVGAVIVARRRPALVLVGASAIFVPPLLSLAAHVHNTPAAFLAPRHLMVALPFWASLIAVGAVSVVHVPGARSELAALAAFAVAALAVLAPGNAVDLRTARPFWAVTGATGPTRHVADWLAPRVRPGDLLFPYAAPYLQALRATRHARGLPRSDPGTLIATIGDDTSPRNVWIALPTGEGARPRPARLRSLERAYDVGLFPHWLIVRVPGPFGSRARVLSALAAGVDAAMGTSSPTDPDSQIYDSLTRATVDKAAAASR